MLTETISQNRRRKNDRSQDYTSNEILDLLQSIDKNRPLTNYQPRNSYNKNVQGISIKDDQDALFLSRNKFSPEKIHKSERVISLSTKESAQFTEIKERKDNSSSIKEIIRGGSLNSLINKRPVSSIQSKSYERNTFDPQFRKKRMQSIGSNPSTFMTKQAVSPTLSMETYCLKMSRSIILSPKTLTKMISEKFDDPKDIKETKDIKNQKNFKDPKEPKILTNQSFQRLKFLGKGKFGQVYLVRHKQTGFRCAMKILNKELLIKQNMLTQLIKQIKIHNALQSLNIVDFYGFFDEKQSFYMLIQYAVDGGMFSMLKNRNRMQQEQIVTLIRGISEGLRHIHRMDYIHRDLKPENIVMHFNIPKICDFGWATECNDLNLCKQYCGTPLYLSPQMIRKQLYGKSVDIWTIGLLTYQFLVGRVAFSIWNQKDLQLILKMAVKIPEYIDRSAECEDFIHKCLQKNAKDRIQIDELLKHSFLKKKQSDISFTYQFYYEAKGVLSLKDRQ